MCQQTRSGNTATDREINLASFNLSFMSTQIDSEQFERFRFIFYYNLPQIRIINTECSLPKEPVDWLASQIPYVVLHVW